MNRISKVVWIIGVCVSFAVPVSAACPSADLNGDCRVDMEDLAMVAAQWLAEGDQDGSDMVFIPGGTFAMGDSLDGFSDESPIHLVHLARSIWANLR